MFRLLALLQLTRAALAFTAIADAWTVMLLRMPGEEPDPMHWTILRMLIVSVVSAGLYSFGMTLNDLLDARRDRIFAKWRPIPSGRVGPRTAIVVALLLLMLSLFAAAMLGAVDVARTRNPLDFVPWPFLFAFATAILIVFYDATSKYLGGIGILTLGAIRAMHCLIGEPKTPLLFLSMFLLTHVFLVSFVAYRLENKRPRLRRWDTLIAFAGLFLGNGLALAYMAWRGIFDPAVFATVWPMLIGPSLAALAFLIWSIFLLRRPNLLPRQKGERLILMGLFWLFVYDASMLFSNRQELAGVAVVALFVCALLSFFGLRALSRMMAQPRLQYRVERTGASS